MLPANYVSQLAEKAYEHFGESYTHSARRLFSSLLTRIDQFLSPLDRIKEKILDLGCGPGILLEHLKNEGFQNILGLDISEESIKEALKRVPSHMLLKRDYHKINFRPNEFSVVFATNSLHYTSKKAFQIILKKISLFLSPRGKLFITLPQGNREQITEESFLDPITNEQRQHVVFHSYYQEDELKNFIEQAGFKITSLETLTGPDLTPPLIVATAEKQ